MAKFDWVWIAGSEIDIRKNAMDYLKSKNAWDYFLALVPNVILIVLVRKIDEIMLGFGMRW